MEPEGSLQHSQEPATCPYPEPGPKALCDVLLHGNFLQWGVVSTLPNP
jgi:hypothetical protein